MLNLIAISSGSEAEKVLNLLQPMLKIKIDVLTDLDQALQEVMLKRPAVVCIQNQIPGISAESVARHIQMLLGFGAPSFVLMHSGDGSVKPVKGLLEHLLDLNLPKEELEDTARTILKTILGADWDNVCISQEIKDMAPTTAPVQLAETSEEIPGKRVKKAALRQDGKKSIRPGKPLVSPQPEQQEEDNNPFELADSLDELMISMQADQNKKQKESFSPVNASLPDAIQPDSVKQTNFLKPEDRPAESIKPVKPALKETLPPIITQAGTKSTPAPSAPTSPKPEASTTNVISRAKPASNIQHSKSNLAGAPPAAASPNGFSIMTTPATSQKQIRENVPAYIEEFQLPNSNRMRSVIISLIVLLCVIAAGWYLTTQKSGIFASFHSPSVSSTPKQKPASMSAAAIAPVIRNASSSQRSPSAASATKLPDFIPAEGRDSAFGDKNPGWERFIGTSYECRIFRENRHIKAVQVLAVKQHTLSEDLLKKILFELVGRNDYHVTSQERNKGFLILRGNVDNKADLMIYTKNSKLHAIVIALN